MALRKKKEEEEVVVAPERGSAREPSQVDAFVLHSNDVDAFLKRYPKPLRTTTTPTSCVLSYEKGDITKDDLKLVTKLAKLRRELSDPDEKLLRLNPQGELVVGARER